MILPLLCTLIHPEGWLPNILAPVVTLRRGFPISIWILILLWWVFRAFTNMILQVGVSSFYKHEHSWSNSAVRLPSKFMVTSFHLFSCDFLMNFDIRFQFCFASI